MKKNKLLIISVTLSVVLILAAVWSRGYIIQRNDKQAFDVKKVLPTTADLSSMNHVFNAAHLAEYSGQNGKECYVAVDGTVYSIKQGNQWQNGQHSPSGGQAVCGKDMSEAIKQSPHGKSKLSTLPIVGTYEQ